MIRIKYLSFFKAIRLLLLKMVKINPLIPVDYINYTIGKGRWVRLSYPPRHVSITIGGYCTNKCLFCAYHGDDSGKDERSKHLYKLAYRLDLDKIKEICERLHRARVPLVHIVAAGEPFLHKDILTILDHVIDKFGDVTTQTNFNRPLFEKRGIVKEIIKRGSHIRYITTDILSYDSETHNSIKKNSDLDYALKCMQEISQKSSVLFRITYILTKTNYKGIDKLVDKLHKMKINCELNIINLDPYEFNEFTSKNNIYNSTDVEITAELNKAKEIAKKYRMGISVPLPYDKTNDSCTVFWEQFQLGPSHKLPRDQFTANAFPRACMANALGNLYTLGDLNCYSNVMDLWNNETLLKIRSNLLQGIYPDYYCQFCKTCLDKKMVFSNEQ